MSSKSLVKVLRKIIREEVRAAVKEVLTEQTTNHKQVISHGMDLHSMTERSKPKTKKSFSSNSMLNDILNETAGTADFASMRQGPLVMQQDSWPNMGSMKTSNMVQTPLATTDVNGAPVNMNNEAVAKTVDIMTRDYSALMKAIDKKKGR
jgi:hypothetical protein